MWKVGNASEQRSQTCFGRGNDVLILILPWDAGVPNSVRI